MIGRAGWLVWSLRALCLALAMGTLVLAFLNGRTPSEILIDEGIVAVTTLAVAFSIVGTLVGVVPSTMQPAHAPPWLRDSEVRDDSAGARP